jgi:hypothetical protein
MVAFEGLFGRFRAASMVEEGKNGAPDHADLPGDLARGPSRVRVDEGPGTCRWSTVLPAQSGVVQLQIDGEHRSHRHGDDHRPAANLLAGKSEVVKRHIAQSHRSIACYADRAGKRYDVEPALHLAPMSLRWLDSLDGDQRM